MTTTTTKAKLGELVWEHRLRAAAAVALLAAAVVSVSAIGPRLGAVVSFFWPLLVSTAFFLVAMTVLLRISPPPAGADDSGKELVDFVAGSHHMDHFLPEACATVEVPPEI